MNNQRMKTEARNFRFSAVAAVVLMIATLICCFTVMTSAQGVTQLQVGYADLDMSNLRYDADANEYYKVYDGTTDVTLAVKDGADIGIADGDDVKVKVVAEFDDEDVSDAKRIVVSFVLEGADADQYVAPDSFSFYAKIRPRPLYAQTSGEASVTYRPGVSTYEGLTVTLPALNTDDIVSGDDVAFSTTAPTVTLNGAASAGAYTLNGVQVALTGADKDNYTAAIDVTVNVEKIKIVNVAWDTDGYSFVWGDAAANAIKVYGYDAEDNAYEMMVTYPAGYGNVNADGYLITATLPDSINMEFDTTNDAKQQAKVVFTKKQFTVSMTDAVHIGNKGLQDKPSEFFLAVEGDLPADIRALIAYACGGQAFTGTADYGVHEIVATLPSSENYVFVDAQGTAVTTLTADLIVNRSFVHTGSDGAEDYEVILIGQNGFSADVKLEVSIPDSIAKKAIKGLRLYKAYAMKVTGAEGETFTVLIPISDSLLSKNAKDLTADDLYLYESATGEKTKANEKAGYTVTVEDGYFRVDGVSGNATLTFILAPAYNTPFLLTAPGIALLVLIVLLILAILFLIGMYLRRIRDNRENAVLVVDEGEVAEAQPVVLEDTVDADAFLDETADTIAENLDVESEAEEPDTEGVEEAVAESMQEMLDEVAAVELDEEADPASEMVEAKVEELQDVEPEADAEAEADEDALRDAVASALEENFNESADATDAVEIVEETAEETVEEPGEETVETFAPVTDDDDDDDDDGDDDDDSFRGFGSMPLTFIDAIAEAEKYAEMLEQERNGEVYLVTRYRRSFQSRLIQSQGNVQDYYTILKNALLSYKGVKNRISWNYEAFNRGRTHVAKLNAKTKTIYLYLALDPEELKDTKYGIIDVSSKKKYATVPVLMKIKGERKFKYALELIAKLCGENLQLPKLEIEEVDYRMPYQTTEELVQEGVIKKLVASVPVAAVEADTAATEEAPTETASTAVEEQEMTFIAPTTVPAVEAAAEEVAEENAAAQDVPADAEASDNDTPTEA